ncbi:MAG: DUF934 domain-containing protein [Sphingomonadaceae bacterium]|nr:DUF934 domain-containing protein [Sphingomonadaceae bacterium]
MTDVQDQAPVAGAPPVPETTAAVMSFRDAPLYDGPVVPLAEFSAASNTAAVRLNPGNDARALLPHLAGLRLIEVAFPKYRDGRGYSSARILRESGYTGELRAAGEVLLDQMVFLRRAGFDSFAPARPLDRAAVDAALSRFPFVYQKAADDRAPIWALRHG